MCALNNGDCQQLCLYRGGGQRTCACAHGMLSEDSVSCRDYDGYLLYSERTILKSIHLSDENNLNAPIKPFEDSEHMKNVIALAFDYRYGSKGSNRIFYSDIHFGNIQQINDDGTGRRTIVESKLLWMFPPTLFIFWLLPPKRQSNWRKTPEINVSLQREILSTAITGEDCFCVGCRICRIREPRISSAAALKQITFIKSQNSRILNDYCKSLHSGEHIKASSLDFLSVVGIFPEIFENIVVQLSF